MPRRVNAKTPDDVAALARPGRHAVGGVSGLTLKNTRNGTKSWVLRTHVNGKRCEFGLGGYPSITLAQARHRARVKLDRIFKQEATE